VINHPRERLDRVELVPFKARHRRGRPTRSGPPTSSSRHSTRRPAFQPRSAAILTGISRDELKFSGLIFTDSMTMDAISKMFSHDQSRRPGVKAGRGFRPPLAGR